MINNIAHHSFAIYCNIGNPEKKLSRIGLYLAETVITKTLLRFGITQKALQLLCCFSSCYFFFPSLFSDELTIFLTNAFWFVTQRACDQECDYFMGHTKKMFSKKIFPKFLFHKRVAHEIRLLIVTSINNMQESTRNSQKLRNKLGRRWQKIQESKEREIKLINKKAWGRNW